MTLAQLRQTGTDDQEHDTSVICQVTQGSSDVRTHRVTMPSCSHRTHRAQCLLPHGLQHDRLPLAGGVLQHS